MTNEKPARKGRIVVYEERCKGCELCTAVCPYGLIHMAEHYNAKGYRPAVFVDPEERCTGCTLCAMMCPDAVITVFRVVRNRPMETSEIVSSSSAIGV